MYQAAKVLNHYNLTYTDLINDATTTAKPYSESTPVFSYYILKCILVYHLNDFIEWCNVHNGDAKILYFKKTNRNIREYGELIGRLYKTDDFIKKMETMMRYYNTLEKQNDMRPELQKSFDTSLRMSLYEPKPIVV
jgi:hypothetical protein